MIPSEWELGLWFGGRALGWLVSGLQCMGNAAQRTSVEGTVTKQTRGNGRRYGEQGQVMVAAAAAPPTQSPSESIALLVCRPLAVSSRSCWGCLPCAGIIGVCLYATVGALLTGEHSTGGHSLTPCSLSCVISFTVRRPMGALPGTWDMWVQVCCRWHVLPTLL